VDTIDNHQINLTQTISCSSRHPPPSQSNNNDNKNKNTFIQSYIKSSFLSDIPNDKIENILAIYPFNIPSTTIINDNYNFNNNNTSQINMIHNHHKKHVILEKSKFKQWWITVPLRYNNQLIEIQLLGDPGSSIPGVKSQIAQQRHQQAIQSDHSGINCKTPQGIIHVNKFITLSFQNKWGTIWTARFYLFEALPVDYLADINLLEAWGYEFPDGAPPAFRDPPKENTFNEQPPIDLDNMKPPLIKPIFNNNNRNNHIKNNNNIPTYNPSILILNAKSSNDPILVESTSIIDAISSNNLELFRSDQNTNHITNYINTIVHTHSNNNNYNNEFNHQNNNNSNWNFDLPPTNINTPIELLSIHTQSQINVIKASKTEIELAKSKSDELIGGTLSMNNLEYLKNYESQLPNLYDETMKVINEFQDIFANHRSNRNTLNIPPIPLGLKPEYRDNYVIYTPQRELNPTERLAMTAITLMKQQSDFFRIGEHSPHNTRYQLINKKGRLREVYDFRKLNDKVEIRPSHVPSVPQVTRFMGRPGLKTIADFLNFYDCLPMAKEDWDYTAVDTPLGKKIMTCWSYGHANSTAAGQTASNIVVGEVNSKYIDSLLAYVDDIMMHHVRIKRTS
jgi:hypothetical protein